MTEFDEDNEDFGDLYTDVESKASRTLTTLLQEEEEEESLDSIETKEAEELEDRSESESESEDELNIVLNDDRDGNFFDNNCEANAEKCSEVRSGVEEVDEMDNEGGGSGGDGHSAQFKLMRSHSQLAVFLNNGKSNVPAGAAPYAALIRDNWEDKSIGPGFSSCSTGTQNWRYFSLPRNRTILDVNIDALEWKPWRHPGVDITDFFNFGLDEDSWKCYCNHLDKCRGKRTEVNGTPSYKPSRHAEHDEVGSEHVLMAEAAIEIDTLSKLRTALSPSHESSHIEHQAQMPKGKAIQVKEGIGERQPSIGVRNPFERDLDVIIQVPIQDFEEDLTNSAKGAADGSSSFVQEASDNNESGDVAANDGGDALGFSSASEDGLPSLELSSEETHKSFPERGFNHTSSDDPAFMDSDDCGSLHVSEADEHHQQEASDSYSDGSSEATRSSDYSKEEGVSNAKPLTTACRKDLDSTNAELSSYSPCSSASQSHDLASRYGAYVEADGFHSHSKRKSPNSVAEGQESVTFDYHSSKDTGRHGIIMKPGDPEYLTRSRSPVRRNNKFHQRKSSRIAEWKSYPHKQEALYVSDSEKFYDLPHPTIGRFIRRNRNKGFDYTEKEDFLYDEGSEKFFYRGGRKSSDTYTRKPHRRAPLDFRCKRDLPHRQFMDGKHHFTGKRMQRSNDDMLEHNLDRFVSRLSVEEMDSIHYDGRRQFIAEQLPFPDTRNHTRMRRKLDELHFRRRKEDFMPECIYSNEYTEESYGCIRNDTKERDVTEHTYDRLLPYPQSPVRSKWKFSSRNKVDETITRRDCEVKKGRYIGNPFTLSYKKYRATGWGPLSRGDGFGRQGVQIRENCYERYTGGKFDDLADPFHDYENVENPDDEDKFGRRRLCLESEVLHWREDKYSSWHAESDFQSERTRDPPLKRTLRSKRSDAKHDCGGKLIGYEFERRCKQLRKGRNGSHFLQNSNYTHKDIVEPILPGSWNSTEKYMVVGNRKSSRCFEGGSLMRNARYEYLDRDVGNNHSGPRFLEDSDESQLENIVRSGNGRSNTFKDATSFDKFPYAKRTPDIEEGQIIAEDFDEEPKGCRNPRILEMMAKMEKRQERFKQPLVNVSEKNDKHSADNLADTKKLQRPARKRKWIAS